MDGTHDTVGARSGFRRLDRRKRILAEGLSRAAGGRPELRCQPAAVLGRWRTSPPPLMISSRKSRSRVPETRTLLN